MRRAEAKRSVEPMLDGKNEAALRNEYPSGTLVVAPVDGKWRAARIVGDVSIAEKKMVAEVYVIPEAKKRREVQAESPLETAAAEIIEDLEEMLKAAKAAKDKPRIREIEEEIADIRRDLAEFEADASDDEEADETPEDVTADETEQETEKISFDFPPQKIEFSINKDQNFTLAGKSGVDAEYDATHIVVDYNITSDGSIEYTVATQGDDHGEIRMFEHIPQELLVLWRTVSRLESDLKVAEQKILNEVALTSKGELLTRVRETDRLIGTAKQQIPERELMSSYEKGEIERIASKFHDLHEQAGDALAALQMQIVEHTADPSHDQVFIKTDEEKKHIEAIREKRQAEMRAFIAEFESQLQEDVADKIQEIDSEEEDKFQKDLAAAKKKYEATEKKKLPTEEKEEEGEAGKGKAKVKPKKAEIPPFDEEAFLKSYKRDPRFAQRRNEIKRAVVLGLFTKLEEDVTDDRVKFTPEEREIRMAFLEECQKRRSELAKKDLRTGRSELKPDRSDYVESVDPDSAYAKKTYDAYDFVSKEWTIDKEVDRSERQEKAFNYDSTINLTFRIEDALPTIPGVKETGTPHEDFKVIHGKLMALHKKIAEDHELYSQPYSAIKDHKKIKGIVEETQFEHFRVQNYLENLQGWHRLSIELSHQLQDKEHPEHAPEKEKPEGMIEIPERMLREKLFKDVARLTAFKEAMRALYGDFFDGSSDPSAKTLEAFKSLMPAKADAEFLAALRPYGVRKWETLKALWDARMAEEYAKTLRVSADAKFKAKIAEKVSGFKKAGKIKAEIAFRVGMTLLLIGGTAVTAGLAAAAWLPGMAVAGTAATLGGAAVGGGIRGWLNKKVFGSEEAQKKMQEKMQQLHLETAIAHRDDLISDLLNDQFGGDKKAEVDYEKALNSFDQLPQLTAIMTEVIKEISAEETKEQTPEELRAILEPKKKEDGSVKHDAKTARAAYAHARGTYERALMSLEPKAREQAKKKLAIAISKTQGYGEELEELMYEGEDALGIQVLDNVLGDIGGRKGILRGAAAGTALAGAFMVGGEYTRGALGYGYGTVSGYKEGKAEDMEEKRQRARRLVSINLRLFDKGLGAFLKGEPNHSDFKATFSMFKRIIHGEIPVQFAHAFYVDRKLDPTGALVAERNDLLTQIKNAVSEAEHAGVRDDDYTEDKERREKGTLRALLHRLEENGKQDLEAKKASVEMVKKELERDSQQFWTHRRVLSSIYGGVKYAVLALGIGEAIDFGKEQGGKWWNQKNVLSDFNQRQNQAKVDELRAQRILRETAERDVIDSSKAEVAGAHGESNVSKEDSAEIAPEKHEVLPPPDDKGYITVGTKEANLIKAGQGTIHALDRFEAESRLSILGETDQNNWTPEQRAAWEEMQKNFKSWKDKQLSDMGYRWVNGKLGGPLSLRKGDEMKLFWDPEAKEWKARFLHYEYDEEGNVVYEKDANGAFKLDEHGKKIPVDRFKGRVSDKLLFTGKGKMVDKSLGEEVIEWEKSIAGKKPANALLEDVRQLDPNYKSDAEQLAEKQAARAEYEKQIKARLGKDPYIDTTLGDGYGPDAKAGAKSAALDMLRASPEIVDSLLDTDDPLGAADELQAFADEFAKDHPKTDSAAFKQAWQERMGAKSGTSGKNLEMEIKAPRVPKLFYEDFARGIDDSETDDLMQYYDDDGIEATIPDDTNTSTLLELDKSRPAANINIETENADNVVEVDFGRPPRDLAAPNGVLENDADGWAATFESKGNKITNMKLEGPVIGREELSSSVLTDPDYLREVEGNAEAAELFAKLADYKQVYDYLKHNTLTGTDEGHFVKETMRQLINQISQELGRAEDELFKSELLEDLGIETLKQAA